MIAHAELAAGRSLSAFFTPLLQTDAVPHIQIETHTAPATITLTQLGDPLFELPVPVRIYTPAGTRDETLILAARTATFPLDQEGPVDSLLVDPDSMTLMRTTAAPERRIQIQGPRPNPATSAGSVFRIYLRENSHVVVSIYDIRGALIEKRDLGTLSVTGPATTNPSQAHSFQWPGHGSRRPASGVYWLRFSTETTQATRKLTLIH